MFSIINSGILVVSNKAGHGIQLINAYLFPRFEVMVIKLACSFCVKLKSYQMFELYCYIILYLPS
jgi:hypothetical protein